MGWKVKEADAEGLPGSISLGKVVGYRDEEQTQPILQEEIFVPGQAIPDEYVAPYLERLANDPEDHLHAFLEGGDIPEASSSSEKSEYEGWSVDDLQTEADSRNLEVEGTGSNGKVLKKDLVAALEASDNPFIS